MAEVYFEIVRSVFTYKILRDGILNPVFGRYLEKCCFNRETEKMASGYC